MAGSRASTTWAADRERASILAMRSIFSSIFSSIWCSFQLALQLLAALGKQLVDLPVIHAVELVQLLDRAGELAVKGDVAQVADGADVRKAVVVSAALKVAQPLLFIVAQGRDGDVEELGNVADFQWVGRGEHLRYQVN